MQQFVSEFNYLLFQKEEAIRVMVNNLNRLINYSGILVGNKDIIFI